MKKIVMILMLVVVSALSFGAVESKLTQDENGRYSGSATLKLVARGRIVARPKSEILVIETEGNNSAVEFLHKGVKNGNTQVTKQQFKATILEKDENGNLVVAKNKNNISSELVNKDGQKDVVVQNLQGENVGKIAYKLNGKKANDNSYVGTITSTLVADQNNSGNFFEKSTDIIVKVQENV